jgi:1-deoxy-D-xylulose-5-phosphate synthase
VAVVGDGALTGGMTWEALNNISDDNDRRLIIVVNDNGRSYAPTIGGMARFLNTVRTRSTYRDMHRGSRAVFDHLGHPGRAFYRGVRGGCTASSAVSRTTRPCTRTSTSSTSAGRRS